MIKYVFKTLDEMMDEFNALPDDTRRIHRTINNYFDIRPGLNEMGNWGGVEMCADDYNFIHDNWEDGGYKTDACDLSCFNKLYERSEDGARRMYEEDGHWDYEDEMWSEPHWGVSPKIVKKVYEVKEIPAHMRVGRGAKILHNGRVKEVVKVVESTSRRKPGDESKYKPRWFFVEGENNEIPVDEARFVPKPIFDKYK